MSFDCFVKFDGIEGESQDSQHQKEIELLSINWGADQSGTSGYGGGAGGGKVAMRDINMTKRFDKASPKLMLACCKGDHIRNAVITLRKAGGEQQEYMFIKLNDVIISSVSAGGSSEGGDDIPLEELSVNFGKIEVEYKEQKEDGTLGGTVKAHWDVKKSTGG
jgi:type VI secretion system secreted protein Hcp